MNQNNEELTDRLSPNAFFELLGRPSGATFALMRGTLSIAKINDQICISAKIEGDEFILEGETLVRELPSASPLLLTKVLEPDTVIKCTFGEIHVTHCELEPIPPTINIFRGQSWLGVVHCRADLRDRFAMLEAKHAELH